MIRAAKSEDLDFIRSSWLKSYSSSEWARLITPRDDDHTTACAACGARSLRVLHDGGKSRYAAGPLYWSGHARLVGTLLSRCEVRVLDQGGLIDGWLVREPRDAVVHYLYVRFSARGTGVARALAADLLEGERVRFTHWPRGLEPSRLPSGWRYDPYFLFEVA